MRFRFWNSGFFLFFKLVISWLIEDITNIAESYLCKCCLFSYLRSYEYNTTGAHYIFSLCFFFKRHRKPAFLRFVSEKNLITTYVIHGVTFLRYNFKRQLRPTNHSRILILAWLVGASAATNIVTLTFYYISEDNLELKLSWAVDIKGFKD